MSAPPRIPVIAPESTVADPGDGTAVEQALRRELDQARRKLAEREVIARAKRLVMQRQSLTEPQAYEKLRRAAMDKGLRIADVAQRILDVADLLG